MSKRHCFCATSISKNGFRLKEAGRNGRTGSSRPFFSLPAVYAKMQKEIYSGPGGILRLP
ncbi:hypothetical protein DXF96_11965 [Heyndrickxia coagulans]|jgi:hypothetical protein|nr:hypothetical protein BIZ35_02635 [Heyndrickxia coagulans]AWP36640.1 hypothetical protein CYJ15_06445 [Heyndrickxia coagulans]KGT38935.1 hypothetical protein P421_07340 [Heyndrickxia coagulans P38]QDI62142.1 hypothetical protein DXF96_11965 [Heyndrickxia coagulans]